MTIRTPDSVKVRNNSGFITQDNPFNTKLHDTTDTAINPATEDKQDDLIAKELIGNSVADGSGNTHHAIVDNVGRIQNRGFRNSSGDGRRMLVDSDRHGQVDVLSLPNGLTGFEIPAYNYIVLTYIASGNGIGEIHTVIYKTGGSGGTTVATLTLVYNADNEISSITKT